MFSSAGASSCVASIATAAHPLCTLPLHHTPQTCFSFAHHSHHIAPFSTPKKPAISPLLFAPPLMQQPATESRLRLMMNHIDDMPEFEPTACFDDLVQKLPQTITFCHKNEIAGLLLPEHAIQREKSKEIQSFLGHFTPEEKTLLKEKLMQMNPKLNHWTAHQNAFLLVKADVSKEMLGDYLSRQLGTFITPDEIHLFLESSFPESPTLLEGRFLDLTPPMQLTAKNFLNETLLTDRYLKNLQQLVTADSSIDQLFGNFFSFVEAPQKSTFFKAAGLVASLKAGETFYWMQQRLAVSQNKLPQWLADSEFLATEKINFEESILKVLREQGPSVDIETIKQSILN